MAQSLIKKLDKVERIEVDEDDNSVMNISFPVSQTPGRVVVEAEHVTKAYGDKTILKDISLLVERGSKVAFVGQNGQGKSTFMKAIVNEFEYEGSIKTAGDTVRVQTLPTLTFTASSITGAGDVTNSDVGTGPGGAISATDFAITLENLVIDKYSPLRVTLTKHQITQSNLSLEEAVAGRFSEAEARLFDTQVRDQILVTQVADIPAANKINSASPVTLTAANIFSEIEKMRVALAEQNVDAELALFVSPSAQSLLLQSGLLDNTDTGLGIRLKGYIGMVSGVKVYVTNSLTASKEMIMMAEGAVNMVVQLNDYKVTEAVDGFYFNLLAEIVWGLKIFGENAKAIAINYVA